MAEPHAYNVFSSRCERSLGSNPGGTTKFINDTEYAQCIISMVAKYAKECALLRKKDMRFVGNLFLDFS